MATGIAITSDQHINSKVALLKPSVLIDEGLTVRASKGQRWLWRCWNEFWYDFVGNFCAKEGINDILGYWGGDLKEGDAKNRSYQIVTPNPAISKRMTIEVMEPALDVTTKDLIIKGTGAHSGKSAWTEADIGFDIEAIVDEATGEHAHFHSLFEIDGVPIDGAHHAAMGRLEWTRMNPLHRLASELMLAYYNAPKVPQIALRSHNHRKGDTFDNHPIRVISTQAWSLATEYVHRIGKGHEPADVGGLLIICDRGKYEILKKNFKPIRTRAKKVFV